ncbi:MAG: hypothetical protein DRP90_04230 [Planctomycetota bacterium]|nr:MAG: hypothetical protein DRP90_04230 [Planctomycetota bacterium]
MSHKVDTDLIPKLKNFGAFDVSACFNCGNCSAVCPLSKEDVNFPRRLIRYGQLGMEDRLLSSRELWLCYYCGECSDTCPRQAEPGEFMASARRYAIAGYEPTGIARLLFTSTLFTWFFITAISVFFALFLISKAGNAEEKRLFAFLPFELIHDMGIAVLIVAALVTFIGIVTMYLKMRRAAGPAVQGKSVREAISAAWRALKEAAFQQRFAECSENASRPWYSTRRTVHLTIMWGFLGLLAATALDYLLLLLFGKEPGMPVLPFVSDPNSPHYDPYGVYSAIRLFGTLAGIAMVYGSTLALKLRFTKPDKYWSHSRPSDWLFLWLVFLAGITGFLLEACVYMPDQAGFFGRVVFLVHVVASMDLLILFPFTKFAHAIYRPFALFFNEYLTGEAETAGAQTA